MWDIDRVLVNEYQDSNHNLNIFHFTVFPRMEHDSMIFMNEALKQANVAFDNNEVPVGCAFVLNNQILAVASNKTNHSLNGTRHAEIEAIDIILSSNSVDIFKNVDLYVTVEPCIMCAMALRLINIRTVYFGCSNDRFGGNGSVFNLHNESIHGSCGYQSFGGLMKEDAIMLLRKFYLKENDSAPVPQKKSKRILKTEIPEK